MNAKFKKLIRQLLSPSFPPYVNFPGLSYVHIYKKFLELFFQNFERRFTEKKLILFDMMGVDVACYFRVCG